MNLKIIFVLTFITISHFFPNPIFSQSFSRVLEVRNPRMNGSDVSNLQQRLLILGFNQIGEADGYYGPRTESAIMDIQKFGGFEENGKVDRLLWTFIFANDEFSINFLRLINTVSKYDKNQLYAIQNGFRYDYWNNSGYEYTIYYASDGKIRILEINGGGGDSGYSQNYYFTDTDKFIVLYHYAHVNFPEFAKNLVHLRLEEYSGIINSGKINYESKDVIDHSELIGILHSLRFR